MAQTIQIRRGTGSAVPSSLAAGELAINTETGKFYYGNGSAVSSDFRVDSITAESYTISSSVTSYTFQALSGSTDFGDDSADIHKRTGSLNVSGSVTIDGALTATDVVITDDLTLTDDVNINATGRIYLSGAGSSQYITSPTTGILELSAGLKILTFDPLYVSNDITASGNISASGHVYADRLYVGNQLALTDANGAVSLGYDNTYPINIGKSTNPIHLYGDVTASGNISASGDLTVSGLYFSGYDTSEDATHYLEFKKPGNTISSITNGVTINPSSDTMVLGGVTTIAGQAGTITGLNSLTSTNITASGNISASGGIVGDLTGNADTATALTSGNKTISGDLTVTDSTPSIKITTSDSSITTGQTLGSILFSNTSDSEIDSAQILAVASENFDDDPSSGTKFEFNLIPKSTSDTTFTNVLTLDADDGASFNTNITASGNISASGEVTANAYKGTAIGGVGTINFKLSSGTNSSLSSFNFINTSDETVHKFTGDSQLIISGSNLGQPAITLEQSAQTATYGPPVFTFNRKSLASDSGDIGRFDFKAKDTAGNETTYAQIIGRTEETLSGAEGGQIELKIASNDAELVTALKLEDGSAEDEVDVTIANGADSLTTIAGNLTTNGTATASTGSFDVTTKALHMIPFAYYVSSGHTSELFIPVAGSLSESAFDQYYHMFHAPYNGTVKRIALSWQSGTPGDSTIRVRKASNFDPDDSGDIVETVVISSAAQDTMYYADFSASFSKGDVVAFTVQQSGTDNSYIGGTIAMEFDTSS